ncbi:MAG: hypothetical protein J2P53_07740 [Bradyrhizobiaceae bacterium]|nr:hypothetical protein [Bradyrhizobiaceae bacterium]
MRAPAPSHRLSVPVHNKIVNTGFRRSANIRYRPACAKTADAKIVERASASGPAAGRKGFAAYGRAGVRHRVTFAMNASVPVLLQKPGYYARNSSPPCALGFT